MRTLLLLILVAVCSPCTAQDRDKAAENKAKLEARREAKKRSNELRLQAYNKSRGFGSTVVPQAPLAQARPAVPPLGQPLPVVPVPATPQVYQTQDIYGNPTSTIVTDGSVMQKYDFYGNPTGYGVLGGGRLQLFDFYGNPTRSIVPLR